MIGRIIRKEILSNLSSPTFLITCLFCSGLILLSIYTGLRSFSDQVSEYRQTEALNRQILGEQTSYSGVRGSGAKISKPVEVLSTLVSGLESVMGRHTLVNTSSTLTLTGSKIDGNPIFAIFGELDLMFIVKTVLSLLAILFTYNTISGEKEDGTLRLTLSHSVPRDSLIFGKMIGGFLCLIIPLGVPFLFGISLISFFPDFQLTGEDWVRLMLILGVFLLYLSVFFALGLFVSARTSRSSISFLVLLLVWVGWVLVVPKGSVILASQFVTVPSVQEYRTREAHSRRQMWRKYQAKIREIHQEIPPPRRPPISPDTPQSKRNEMIADVQKAFEERLERIREAQNELDEQREAEWEEKHSKMEQEYNLKRESLAKLAISLSRISPSSAMTYASMGLAGTGIENRDRFLTLAKDYKENFTYYITSKIQEERRQVEEVMIYRSKTITSTRIFFPFSDDTQPVDIGDMPIFQYQEEPLSDVLGRITIDLLLIVLLSIAFFTGAYFSFLKYDPR